MRPTTIVAAVAVLCLTIAAQAQDAIRMPLIGEKAPAFKATTTEGSVDFPADYSGRWVIFFSHPADFTPVCTTEFMAFAKAAPEFKQMNCDLLGLSIDSNYSHIAWLRTIAEKASYKDMKNLVVPFPVVADISMDVARKYGMLQPTASNTQAVRAVFFVDPQSTIRAILYYPLSNGRNIDEIKRLLLAMQTTDQFAVATPVNWTPGDEVIIPTPGSCGVAAERVANAQSQGYRCVDWFLCFKPSPLKAGQLPSGKGPQPAPK